MLSQFIQRLGLLFPEEIEKMPWQVTGNPEEMFRKYLAANKHNYVTAGDSFIHKTAVIEQNVVMKGLVIIGAGCVIGANAYIRGPVFLDEGVKIGAGCEIKQSIIFSDSAIAHFNYVGNSIIGSRVNFEAGSVAANHYNERTDKKITVLYNSQLIATGVEKFGTLAGDGCRIGANAVLSPGTLLLPGTIVGRLELVRQVGG